MSVEVHSRQILTVGVCVDPPVVVGGLRGRVGGALEAGPETGIAKDNGSQAPVQASSRFLRFLAS